MIQHKKYKPFLSDYQLAKQANDEIDKKGGGWVTCFHDPLIQLFNPLLVATI